MRKMRKVAILGSRGSIGRQSVRVVDPLPARFSVVALAAGENLEQLATQVLRHRPQLVSVAEAARADQLAARLRSASGSQRMDALPEVSWGSKGLEAVATHCEADMVVSAAVGVVGLEATYAAVRHGKQVALSNKEVLVAAGEMVMAAARASRVELLPVDSEHNAIHQCLRSGEHHEVRRLVLTASGGPFRKTPLSRLATATPEQALAHPNWRMGQRITIDSATLMNKGFEVIEAHWLFGMRLDQIEVVIHPQSTVHSMVEFVDGSILAQLGATDMRVPIQYALTYPERVASNGCQLDWAALRRLDFDKGSPRRFSCLGLAREALRQGGGLASRFKPAHGRARSAVLRPRLPVFGIAPGVRPGLWRLPPFTFSQESHC